MDYNRLCDAVYPCNFSFHGTYPEGHQFVPRGDLECIEPTEDQHNASINDDIPATMKYPPPNENADAALLCGKSLPICVSEDDALRWDHGADQTTPGFDLHVGGVYGRGRNQGNGAVGGYGR